MNIPQPLIVRYSQLHPFLEEVEKRLIGALANFSKENAIPLLSRVKTVESVAEKIETGRYRSFSEIDDLVAVTLIVPTFQHEPRAVDYCRAAFNIRDEKKRGSTRKPPDAFRFDTTRLYGRLRKPDGADVGLTPNIFEVLFEIQVRSAFEHAWIVATHPLTYKSASVDWRRFRLAAQMKAGVEQFDLLFSQFDELAGAVNQSPWPPMDQQHEIAAFVQTMIAESIIPAEAAPKDISRFAENLLALLRASRAKPNSQDVVSALDEGCERQQKPGSPKAPRYCRYVWRSCLPRE